MAAADHREHERPPTGAQVRCKPKHRALKQSTPSSVRGPEDLRSQCPGWAGEDIRERLLSGALVDPEGGRDCHGRPRKIWNAVDGVVFVGVSSNESIPAYNCYPDIPGTILARELQVRARRARHDLVSGGDEDGAP